jgi:hypothetical protein
MPKLSGVVHGGQQAVSGATIQMYSVNTATVAGASTPMLTSAVTTDSSGSFTITGLYTCPVSNPFVYIVSTGGNPGLGGSVNNTDIVLMAALGTCNTLSSATFINIDELTTATAVQELAPFMTDATHIGSSPTNLSPIGQGFQTATSLINLGTGGFKTSALFVQELQIATLANILAACVNTSGGSSGDGSACGNLMLWAGSGSTDTVTAALHIVQAPTNNATNLYGLIVGTPPFQPYFTSVPTDLTVTLGFAIPPNIRAAALDSTGQFWLYTGGYTYNTQTDTSTDLQGVLTVYDNSFNPLHTISPGTGGLYYPVSAASDASGHVFFVNANNTISEFNSSGTALSPSGGWSTGVATTFTGSGSGNSYVLGSNQVEPIAADSLGNIWGLIGAFGASSCYVEMNSSGTVITPAGTFCSPANTLAEIAPDGSGNAWTNGSMAISEVSAAGATAATAPSSPSCFDPSTVAILANPTGGVYVATDSLRYDHVHNQVWGYSYTGAGAITDGGTGVFCDAGSATLPVIPVSSPTGAAGSAFSGGNLVISSGTLDGAGNFWYMTGGIAATGVVGTTTGTFTGTAKFSTYLNGISPSGALLTTYNAGANAYGMQPSGVGANATAAATNATPSLSISVGLLGVDVNGNLWVEDILSNRVIPLKGVATANSVNY